MDPTDGAFFQFGSVGNPFLAITDGLSNTLMVGEKHIPRGWFGKGWYDNCYYNGDYTLSTMRAAGPDFPLAQSPTDNTAGWVFGSYHPGMCPFAFCDGSVRSLVNSTDRSVLGLLACRNDGLPIPPY
jgi:prepilin-type processing-associated H-X9-DG protein